MAQTKKRFYPAIQMTSTCNKSCKACLRSLNKKPETLRYNEFIEYTNDLRRLSTDFKISSQFVTGGEPTIWQDSGKNIIDILKSFDRLDFVKSLVLPTNGKVFEDFEYAKTFLGEFSTDSDGTLIVGVSIAEYQENFSDDTGCVPLDNIQALSLEIDINVLPVILLTLSVSDDLDERLKRRYPKVFQRITPLTPLGEAQSFREKCPSLTLAGNNKESLGSYLPHFMRDVMGKLRISMNEFMLMPNADIMNRLSLFNHCGNSPFITHDWHYCLPFKDDPAFTMCSIGEMESYSIQNFIESKDFLSVIREEGVVAMIRKYRDRLSKKSREKVDEIFDPETLVSVAYRGCMVCKRMHELGIIDELMENY